MKGLSRGWRIYAVVVAAAAVAACVAFGFLWFALSSFGDYEAPHRKHWAESRDAFSALIATMPLAPDNTHDWNGFAIPERVGNYDVEPDAYRVKGGMIIFDSRGIADAGFAYLPDGPYPELENGSFEAPDYLPLGDGWYSWSASW